MQKVDQTVRKETGYIAYVVLILSVLMQAVFLIIGKWDYTVLLGNTLGAVAAILNFFLMGLTVQCATQKEEKNAKNTMKLSQNLRTVCLFAIAALGVLLSCFSAVATLIPLFFPRIAAGIRPLFLKKEDTEYDTRR